MRYLLVVLAAFQGAAAQAAAPRPLGTWTVEYDRASTRLHGEPVVTRERGRMIVRAVGDSILGELVMGDSARDDRSILRGVARGGSWTVYSEEPNRAGIAVLLIPIEAAMDWLRETMHGMQPWVVRFDIVAKGDSLTGTRTVTGGLPGAGPRVSAVKGRRVPAP